MKYKEKSSLWGVQLGATLFIKMHKIRVGSVAIVLH